MLQAGQTLTQLQTTSARTGKLDWIGVRPSPRGEMMSLQQVLLITNRGIEGDHRAQRPGGKRQVTLIQAEHLPVIASLAGRTVICPEELRRNLVVCCINLASLNNQRFTVGAALLEGTGYCHPCSRMEENLGTGGYNAVRGHGGITARVVRGGLIRPGDEVILSVAPDNPAPFPVEIG